MSAQDATLALAVTGLGCVTPCGNDVSSFWGSLIAGRSGIARVTAFDTNGYDVHIAGEVKDFDPTAYGMDVKEARRLDRYVHFALAAGQEAVRHARLDAYTGDPYRVGIIIGTGIGGIRAIEQQMDILRKKGPSRVSPLL